MAQHKYTLDTAPAELYQKFIEKFSQDKDVIKLEQKLQNHQRQKDYVQVLKLRQTLQKKKEMAFDIYVNSVLYEGRRIDISKTDLPAEVKERMHILYVTAFIGCDIIESAILDMNDLLKKQDPTLSFETFKDIQKMAKTAKEKIEMFQKDSGYQGTPIWRERCDDMYKMAQSKAGKIHNKNKEM